MLQTPWYLDYGHLVFWFFFFSTFVLVMWLFYIYSSLAHNIESRRPVRETRGFSRAQVGDALTAVLPLTWSITMLAHASTHSANFDENTTATVFSFSVIAYQWGWNYYFPRDIVEVLSAAPSLVGHKRAVSLSGMDPYASLLAKARQEYYSRLTGATQLGARHGKHTLNQYLLAAYTGPKSTAEHTWLSAGLRAVEGSVGVRADATGLFQLKGTAPLSQDMQLTALKGFSSVSSGLNLNLYKQGVLALKSFSGHNGLEGGTGFDPLGYPVTRLKSGTNPFRAHSTATFVGNRLNRVYAHLASASVLPVEYTRIARQGATLQALLQNAPERTQPMPAHHTSSSESRLTLLEKTGVHPANVGANLWLLRGPHTHVSVAQPWLLVLSQTQRDTPGGLYAKQPYPSVLWPAEVQGGASTGLLSRSLSGGAVSVIAPKALDLDWLTGRGPHCDFVHRGGQLDLFRLLQRFAFSGEELAASGGELQKLSVSDIAWLSPNATSELGNLNRLAHSALKSSLVGRLLPLHTSNIRTALNPQSVRAGFDLSSLSIFGGARACEPYALSRPTLAELTMVISPGLTLAPFRLNASKQAAQSVLTQGYSRFSVSSLTSQATALAEPYGSLDLGGHLGFRGLPPLLSAAGLCGTGGGIYPTARLLGLRGFNLNQTAGLGTTMGVLASVNGRGAATGVALRVRSQPLLPQVHLAPALAFGVGGSTLGLASMLTRTLPFSLGAEPINVYGGVRAGCFALQSFCPSLVLPQLVWPVVTPEASHSTTKDMLPTTSAIGALLLPLYQIIVGKFVRLDLEYSLFGEVRGQPEILGVLHLYRPASAEVLGEVSLARADASLAAMARYLWSGYVAAHLYGLGVCNAVVKEHVYAPTYLYLSFKFIPAQRLHELCTLYTDACFLASLGFTLTLNGLFQRKPGLSLDTAKPDVSLFFSHMQTSVDSMEIVLRTLHVSGVPLTWLTHVTAGEWPLGVSTSPVTRLRVYVRLLWAAPLGWMSALVTASRVTTIPFVEAQAVFASTQENIVGKGLRQRLTLCSGFFSEPCLNGNYPAGSLGYTYPLFSLAVTSPALDAHWLEGVSDMYPTRVTGPASNDPIFLNAKDLKSLDRNLSSNSAELFDWWSRWSWEVLSANLPWERLSRSWAARRVAGGAVGSENADASRHMELTEVARQRFDKNRVEVLLPHIRRYERMPTFPEIALPALDSGFGCNLFNQAVVLPLPYVDVDPAFMSSNLAPEVNTSRRNDHDARYKVTWGPVAALSSLVNQGKTADTSMPDWSRKSGPQARLMTSVKSTQRQSLFAGIDLFAPNAALFCGTRRLAAQPQPGALFSNLVQAPIATGLPLGVTRGALVNHSRDQTNFSQVNPLVGLTGALATLVKNPQGDSSQVFSFPADWSTVWGLGSGLQPDLCKNMAIPEKSFRGADLLSLLIGAGECRTTTALVAWKQGKRLGHSADLLDGGRSLLALAAGHTDDTPLSGLIAATSVVPAIRSGYVAIQPGVSIMRRLRVTQGIYLPADLPVHGIFGSKDVIHSWAIPGLGVKIDCIPGYSSHRRLFFRWRGLFWGQCMEVCGRYHHWMPLLVRVVHKDVFILWCLTYLRLLTSSTLTGTYSFSLEASQLAWEVAAGASTQSSDWVARESLASLV